MVLSLDKNHPPASDGGSHCLLANWQGRLTLNCTSKRSIFNLKSKTRPHFWHCLRSVVVKYTNQRLVITKLILLILVITLKSPLGVPKKVPFLGINYQRKTNSPLIDWHRFFILLTTLRAVDDAFGITHLMTFWHTGRQIDVAQ